MKGLFHVFVLLPLLVYASWTDKYSDIFNKITDSLNASLKENVKQHIRLMDSADKQHEEVKILIEVLSAHIGNVTEKDVFDYVGIMVKNVEQKIKEWKLQVEKHNSEIQEKRLKQTEDIKKSLDNIFQRYEVAQNCYDLYLMGLHKNGVYAIKPKNMARFSMVYCDMENGGWTVIQRRDYYATERVGFDRTNWGYAKGFGNPEGEFWLGNEAVYLMTKDNPYELIIEMTSFNNITSNATFSTFYLRQNIGSTDTYYYIHLSGGSPKEADAKSQKSFQSNTFTTNDITNCNNKDRDGGWWVSGCYEPAYLNGKHGNITTGSQGSITFDGVTRLTNTLMKIKPRIS